MKQNAFKLLIMIFFIVLDFSLKQWLSYLKVNILSLYNLEMPNLTRLDTCDSSTASSRLVKFKKPIFTK